VLQAVVKFVNKNAYIVQAMTGEPFLDAAMHALSLLTHNLIAVAGVTVISEFVMFFSKIIITSASLGVGYLILRGFDDFSSAGLIFMLIFIGITSYFVGSVFLSVFGVCIDTVVLSYCYDLEQNNGQGRPYFFPEDLAKHLDTARERMASSTAPRSQQFDASSSYKKIEPST
jgi:choline transporter-like protein 2/4/5